jgi:hypothetical protein
MLVLPLPGIAVLSWGVVILGGVKHKEKNYEDMVSHQSAVRSRDLRNDPDLSASNATWCRTERRWGEGHHLRARPSSPAAGGKTRVSTRATCCPSRLLILFERQRLAPLHSITSSARASSLYCQQNCHRTVGPLRSAIPGKLWRRLSARPSPVPSCATGP